MSDDINIHKISDKEKRRAEHIERALEKKGMGRDHAEKEAMRQAMDETGGSAGGGSAAADAPKHANHQGDHRQGTDKKTHSG